MEHSTTNRTTKQLTTSMYIFCITETALGTSAKLAATRCADPPAPNSQIAVQAYVAMMRLRHALILAKDRKPTSRPTDKFTVRHRYL